MRGDQRRIAEQLDENARAAAHADALARELVRAPAVDGERRRLQGRLRGLDLGTDAARSLARFLRGADAVARRHNALVLAVSADQPPRGTRHPTTPLALTVDLSGRYGDLLGAVADLSRMGVPAGVDVVALTRARTAGSDPSLTASLRVALPRVTLPADDRARTP
ncbi:MAG TPA: hypothetical protein VMD91_05055 [Candidatus Sulfotelmatobacter sp.]|nr:hypothetical protein [Candidatus Sulfotelmatobacter sp.]